MQDLRLIGVHEDGHHLLLAGADGARFTVPLDDALRAAARRDRPRLGQLQIEMDTGLRPRDVQAMIRSGASTQEVAERSGWSVEKVRKYEGPILAERAYVADLARQVRMRVRGAAGGGDVPTLAGRVAKRMRGRGVDPSTSEWDAWRSPDDGRWTVVLSFVAGGRERQACWVFDPASRIVDAADDEARWLSEDEDASASAKGPLGRGPLTTPRAATVYDVEAEGGVGDADTGSSTKRDDPVDLMTAMRERSTVRGRRSPSRRRPAPSELPGIEDAPADALPLERLDYNPVVDGLPPAAHGHPDNEPSAIAAAAEHDEPPRRTGRASVPSWDDIMFGARRD